jgi:hypothetical protein
MGFYYRKSIDLGPFRVNLGFLPDAAGTPADAAAVDLHYLPAGHVAGR